MLAEDMRYCTADCLESFTCTVTVNGVPAVPPCRPGPYATEDWASSSPFVTEIVKGLFCISTSLLDIRTEYVPVRHSVNVTG